MGRQGIQLSLADAHADVRDILRAEGLEAHVSRIDRRTSMENIVQRFDQSVEHRRQRHVSGRTPR